MVLDGRREGMAHQNKMLTVAVGRRGGKAEKLSQLALSTFERAGYKIIHIEQKSV